MDGRVLLSEELIMMNGTFMLYGKVSYTVL
jgi:hypothetical protein